MKLEVISLSDSSGVLLVSAELCEGIQSVSVGSRKVGKVPPTPEAGGSDDEGVRVKTLFTLPHFDALTLSNSSSSRNVARLKVSLARLQIKAQERKEAQDRQLEIRKLEIEADKAIRLRQLELRSQDQVASVGCEAVPPFSPRSSSDSFDVT